jgi:hypothetical protein
MRRPHPDGRMDLPTGKQAEYERSRAGGCVRLVGHASYDMAVARMAGVEDDGGGGE